MERKLLEEAALTRLAYLVWLVSFVDLTSQDLEEIDEWCWNKGHDIDLMYTPEILEFLKEHPEMQFMGKEDMLKV